MNAVFIFILVTVAVATAAPTISLGFGLGGQGGIALNHHHLAGAGNLAGAVGLGVAHGGVGSADVVGVGVSGAGVAVPAAYPVNDGRASIGQTGQKVRLVQPVVVPVTVVAHKQSSSQPKGAVFQLAPKQKLVQPVIQLPNVAQGYGC